MREQYQGRPAKVEGMQRPGASEPGPPFAAPYQNGQERMRAGGPGGRWRKIRRGAGGKHPARFPALVGAIGGQNIMAPGWSEPPGEFTEYPI